MKYTLKCILKDISLLSPYTLSISMNNNFEIPEKGTKSTASSPSFLFDGDDFDDNHKNVIQWAGAPGSEEVLQ